MRLIQRTRSACSTYTPRNWKLCNRHKRKFIITSRIGINMHKARQKLSSLFLPASFAFFSSFFKAPSCAIPPTSRRNRRFQFATPLLPRLRPPLTVRKWISWKLGVLRECIIQIYRMFSAQLSAKNNSQSFWITLIFIFVNFTLEKKGIWGDWWGKWIGGGEGGEKGCFKIFYGWGKVR